MADTIRGLLLALTLVAFPASQAAAAPDGERVVDLVLSYMELEGLSAVERPTVSVSGSTVTLGPMRFIDPFMLELGLDTGKRGDCPPPSCVELPLGLALTGVRSDGIETFTAESLQIATARGALGGFAFILEDLSISPVRLAPIAGLGTESIMDGPLVHLARHHDGVVAFGNAPRTQTTEVRHASIISGTVPLLAISNFTQVSEISEDLAIYEEITRVGAMEFTLSPSLVPPAPILPMSGLGLFALENLSRMAMKARWHADTGIETTRLEIDLGAFGVVDVTAEVSGVSPHALRETVADLAVADMAPPAPMVLESGHVDLPGPQLLDAWLAGAMPGDTAPLAAFIASVGIVSPNATAAETERMEAFLAGEEGLRIALAAPVPFALDDIPALLALNPVQAFVPGQFPVLRYEALP